MVRLRVRKKKRFWQVRIYCRRRNGRRRRRRRRRRRKI
jgi:hypothetical protein